MTAQGAAESLAGLLSLLKDEDSFRVSVSADDEIVIDAETANYLVRMLEDFLPECWTARTWYGYPRPDGCAFPNAICFNCARDGRRMPTQEID